MKQMNLRHTLKNQAGATMGSIIFNVAILILIGFAVSKVAVFYIDNNTANNSLQDLRDVPYITKKSKGEVAEILRKKFQANNLSFTKDEIFIEKRSDRLVVDLIYERRANIISNIDVVVSFENHFETVTQ